MSGFLCKKCNSNSFFIKDNGPHKAIYCNDCGAWQKNLTKDEVNMYTNKLLTESCTASSVDQQMIGYANALKLYCMARTSCSANSKDKQCIFYDSKNNFCTINKGVPGSWDLTDARVNLVSEGD
jgi:hypothetical protein